MKLLRIGGSLLSELRILKNICNFLEKWSGDGILIVPGGGNFSREVKKLQNNDDLTDTEAHWMAIKSIEIMATLLRILIPKSISTIIPRATPMDHIDIFFPYQYLKQKDILPHTWDATSDSIAALIGIENKIKTIIKVTAGPDDTIKSLDATSRGALFENIKWNIVSIQQKNHQKTLELFLHASKLDSN